MRIDSQPLLRKSHVILVFLIALVFSVSLYYSQYPNLSLLIFFLFFFFYFFYLVFSSEKISIEENMLTIGGRKYRIPEDIIKYKVKNEKYEGLNLHSQFITLYLRDKDVFVISSRSFANYNELKKAFLDLMEVNEMQSMH